MVRAEADIRSFENALEMLTTDAGGPITTIMGTTLNGLSGAVLEYGSTASIATLLSVMLMDTATNAYLLEPGARNLVSDSYMSKGLPRDPWGNEYQICVFFANPTWSSADEENLRAIWTQEFRRYRPIDSGLPACDNLSSYPGESCDAPRRLDYYIYSLGEDRVDDNRPVITGSLKRNGYDDVNNWDAERGWSLVYR